MRAWFVLVTAGILAMALMRAGCAGSGLGVFAACAGLGCACGPSRQEPALTSGRGGAQRSRLDLNMARFGNAAHGDKHMGPSARRLANAHMVRGILATRPAGAAQRRRALSMAHVDGGYDAELVDAILVSWIVPDLGHLAVTDMRDLGGVVLPALSPARRGWKKASRRGRHWQEQHRADQLETCPPTKRKAAKELENLSRAFVVDLRQGGCRGCASGCSRPSFDDRRVHVTAAEGRVRFPRQHLVRMC